MEDKKLIWH